MKKWVPWITTVVVLAGLVWSFVYLKDLHPFGPLGARLDRDHLAGIGLRINDAVLVGRADGKKAWQIHARTIDVSKDRRVATFRGISQGCLLVNGNRAASIGAGRVVYNTLTRNLSIPGTAELKVKDDLVFRAKNSYWSAAKSKLVCLSGVEADLHGSTVRGERMIADFDKKQLDIWKVSGVIRLEE